MKVKANRKLVLTPTIELSCEPEVLPYQGNAMASGDDEIDAATENAIEESLLAGNQWAWCCVKVTATVEPKPGLVFTGVDYLGCCSYTSQDDFARSDYYQDMIKSAIDDLENAIKSAAHTGRVAGRIVVKRRK